jgi:hypothetical protein
MIMSLPGPVTSFLIPPFKVPYFIPPTRIQIIPGVVDIIERIPDTVSSAHASQFIIGAHLPHVCLPILLNRISKLRGTSGEIGIRAAVEIGPVS